MQVVLVSREEDEREVLTFILRKAGLAVASSGDHRRVLSNWTDHPADMIVIAASGEISPLKVVEEVRATTQVPFLMIVDPIPEHTLCGLLDQGTDIVLVRPVSSRVLTSHVQAILRRSASIPSFVLPTLTLEQIALDPSTRTVTVTEGEPRRLTQLEFRLLYTLMTHRGQVLPTEVIVERVWGYTGEGNRDLVRGLVSRLRQKIEPDPEAPRFLETVPGVGYRFISQEI
jgi:DNA-binding response OmpR family regulator